MTRLLTCLLLAMSMHAGLAAASPADLQEIQYLISAVGSLQNAHFIRNGARYDAATAADHLRLKLQKAGSRVKTADDFIRLCASGSSVSGQAYEIAFDDGRTVTSERFLRDKLSEFRKAGRRGE